MFDHLIITCKVSKIAILFYLFNFSKENVVPLKFAFLEDYALVFHSYNDNNYYSMQNSLLYLLKNLLVFVNFLETWRDPKFSNEPKSGRDIFCTWYFVVFSTKEIDSGNSIFYKDAPLQIFPSSVWFLHEFKWKIGEIFSQKFLKLSEWECNYCCYKVIITAIKFNYVLSWKKLPNISELSNGYRIFLSILQKIVLIFYGNKISFLSLV